MNYKMSSKLLALSMINQTLNAGFREKDIDIVDVTYLEEGIFNTRVKLIPALNSSYQDDAVIEYDRINMQKLFKGITVVVKPAFQKKISDYLPIINEKYDLALTDSDIIDGIIPEGTKAPYRIKIKINPNNPAFYGEFEILVSDSQKSIRNMVDGITFTGIPYPTQDKDSIQGALYHYGEDWSELANLFSGYLTSQYIDKKFVEEVNLYTRDNWVYEEKAAKFNYYNSHVLYNGVIEENNEYTRKVGFTHVLVIQLSDVYCKEVSGHLVFHYNVNTDYIF